MSSRPTSPSVLKKRSKPRLSGKHTRNESLSSEAANRLLQSSAMDHASPRSIANRSTSGRTKASTINDQMDFDDDVDSSEVDETDYGMDTFVNYQETSAEKTRMKILLDSFNEDQMARYEVFRRVGLNNQNIKRLANNILAQTLPQNIAVVIRGSSKIFVGEIIERARQVQRERGQSGSLTPEHLRDAYRQYRSETSLLPHNKRRLFR